MKLDLADRPDGKYSSLSYFPLLLSNIGIFCINIRRLTSLCAARVVLLLFFVYRSQTDADISVLRNIQVDKIRFDVSHTSVTNSVVSEVRQTLFILRIAYLHLVAYFYSPLVEFLSDRQYADARIN